MKRKKRSAPNWTQLELPFGCIDSSNFEIKEQNNINKSTIEKELIDNVVCLSSKKSEITNREYEIVRRRSINKLVNYAESLNW